MRAKSTKFEITPHGTVYFTGTVKKGGRQYEKMRKLARITFRLRKEAAANRKDEVDKPAVAAGEVLTQ